MDTSFSSLTKRQQGPGPIPGWQFHLLLRKWRLPLSDSGDGDQGKGVDVRVNELRQDSFLEVHGDGQMESFFFWTSLRSL